MRSTISWSMLLLICFTLQIVNISSMSNAVSTGFEGFKSGTLKVVPSETLISSEYQMYLYPLQMSPGEAEVVVGVMSMTWNPIHQKMSLTPWSLQYTQEDTTLLIKLYSPLNSWQLTLSILQINPQFAYTLPTSTIYLDQHLDQSYIELPLAKNKESRKSKQKKINWQLKMLQKRVTPFMVIDGMEFDQNVQPGGKKLQIILKQYWHNENYLMIKNLFKGVKKINYKMLVLKQYYLLEHGLQLSVGQQQAPQNVLSAQLLSSFMLTPVSQSNSYQLALVPITCPQYTTYSPKNNQCQLQCIDTARIGTMSICLTASEPRLLSGSHSHSHSCSGSGSGRGSRRGTCGGGWAEKVVPCPGSITNCATCIQNYALSQAVCSVCNSGYYPTSAGKCQPCPTGCATCRSGSFMGFFYVICDTCLSTFTRTKTGLVSYSCSCKSTQYMTSTPSCLNCPTGCSSCTSASTCTGCINQYYLSGGNCLACMPVCKTCTGPSTCTSCLNNLHFTGSSCQCQFPNQMLDPITLACRWCSYFDPNCATCAYNPAYSPSSPVPVVCSVAKAGFFVQGDHTTAACPQYCNICVDASTCTICFSTFPAPVSGVCDCSPNYLTANIPATCDTCGNIVDGCNTCSFNGTVTQCTNCNSNYFTISYPTTSCTPCDPICSTCSLISSYCTSCPAGMSASSGICTCNTIGHYIDTISLTCQICSNIIVNCNNCDDSVYPPQCSSCNIGSYISANGLLCISCPINCNTCNNMGCTACNTGYALNGTSGMCQCDATCVTCGSLTAYTCSQCTTGPIVCSACANGYYLTSPTCSACLPTCQQCTTPTSCTSCSSPFILSNTLQCICNNTNSQFLTLDSSTCRVCGIVITNCVRCQAGPPTICLECSSGLYYDGGLQQCVPCTAPCANCNITATTCTSCLPTYTLSLLDTCYCDNSSQLFYSAATQGCLLCGDLIQNCLSCQSDPVNTNQTICNLCAAPYYADASGACVHCPIQCTSCTSIGVCGGCATNMVLVNNTCQCDPNDTSLLYYSTTNLCISCLTQLSNCLSCTGSPLNCTSCLPGTYIDPLTNICLNCPTTCTTCNQTACLTCPTGMTLVDGVCQCGTTCATCQVTAPGCTACTVDASGVVTVCSVCMPGSQIGSDGASCVSCSTGCATCAAGVCNTCLPTFILSGSRCICDASLNLYLSPSSPTCSLCSSLFPGCSSCSFDGTSTSCSQCHQGMFLNLTQCSYCAPQCLTCGTSSTDCTGCPLGYVYDGSGGCNCGSGCSGCMGNVSGCVLCTDSVAGGFGQCTACAPGKYLDNGNYTCIACPVQCATCDSSQQCLSCSPTLQVLNGTCQCNPLLSLHYSPLHSLCLPCTTLDTNCSHCISDPNSTLGFICSLCNSGYYLLNSTCTLQICGDGYVSPSQQCDDGNDITQDGCSYCIIDQNYRCQGEPSVCLVEMEFSLSFDSVSMSTKQCNQLTFYFNILPIYAGYRNVDLNLMYAYSNNSKIQIKNNSAKYTPGTVAYTFILKGDIIGKKVGFLFMPSKLGLPQTSKVPLYAVYLTIPSSINSVPVIYQSQQACAKQDAVQAYSSTVEYASYGVMVASAIPCKIVGLELMGVLQLSYLSLGNIDHLNPVLASLTAFSGSNGMKIDMDDQEPTKTRLLQASALTPGRVQTIGYASNFIRNCNLMLLIVCIVLLIAFLLYLLTYLCKSCAPSLYSLSRRLLKQVLLTLILFNCFNFAYSAGLHFTYADKDDPLYIWGTFAAIATMVLPLGMIAVLQCGEEDGFGEYKDKLRGGKLQRAYFMVTIMYRMGIGYYIAVMNQDDLSTLIVLAISIFFLLYNLVNLPFRKAYHNYRANICHFAQFICLFVAMYYRSMMSGASQRQLDNIYIPVYLQLGAIGVSLLVSLVVLVYEVGLWIWSVKEWCRERKEKEEVNQTQISPEMARKGSSDLFSNKEENRPKKQSFAISLEDLQ